MSIGPAFDTRAYWESRLAEAQGLEGVGFTGLGHRINAAMYAVRKHVFRRTIKKHLNDLADKKVLDIGSGTGFYLDQWLSQGVTQVHGSDLTDAAIEKLHRTHPTINTVRWDVSDKVVPFHSKFDAISCFDVMFHLVNDEKFTNAIKNMRDLLAPDGLLFLSDNFLHDEAIRYPHCVSRTLAHYDQVLASHDLEIVGRYPVFVLLNYPIDSRSPILFRTWTAIEKIAKWDPFIGGLVGWSLFPFELLLTRIYREGPSTEILVCRARRNSG